MRYLWSAMSGRPARAICMVVLGLWAGLLAGVGPAFITGADGEVVSATVASATLREQQVVEITAKRDGEGKLANQDFDHVGGQLHLPGFDTVYSSRLRVGWGTLPPKVITPLEYRSGVCDHLRLRGRCPAAAGEIAIAETAAAANQAVIGSATDFRWQILVPNTEVPPIPKWLGEPSGPPVTLTVVGIYTVTDPAELYWGSRPWAEDAASPAPLYATAETESLFQDTVGGEPAYLLVPTDTAFTTQRVDALAGDLAALKARANSVRGDTATHLDELLTRIGSERAELRLAPFGVAGVLAVIVWVLAYLLASGEAEHRRGEHGLLRLNGVPAGWRFGLSIGSTLVPLLAGFVAGAALAPLLVWAGWSLVFPGQPSIGLGGLAAPAAYLAGLLILAALALGAELRVSTMELLREVSRPRRRWIGLIAEVIGVVVVAVALIQLRSDSGWGGSAVAQLIPAAVIAVGAAVLARLGLPLVRLLGRWSLRRGRLATAIAALQVARGSVFRPLAVALCMVAGFTMLATATGDVSQVARERQAELSVGADRVLRVTPVDAGQLLSAVHRADGGAGQAMAVAISRNFVAVDSPYLTSVVRWPTGIGDLGEIAHRLHPAASSPLRLRTPSIRLTVNADLPPGSRVRIGLIVLPPGTTVWHSPTVPLEPGQHEITIPASLCLSGCRIVGLTVEPSAPVTGTITVRSAEPVSDTATIDPAVFSDASRWKFSGTGTAGDGAVSMQLSGTTRMTAYLDPTPGVLVLVPTQPYTAKTLHMGQVFFPVQTTTPVTAVPRELADGALLDLEALDQISDGDAEPDAYEVWLTADAPADFGDRLAAEGIGVIGERTLTGELQQASRRAAALGQRFTLVGAVLGAFAGVSGLVLLVLLDRRRRAGQVAVLAIQGLRRRSQRRLAWLSYALVGLVAMLVGPLLGAVAFVALDPAARAGVDRSLVPIAPRPTVMLAVWAALAVLFLVAPMVAAQGRKGSPR